MESTFRQQGSSADAEGSDEPLAILIQEKNRLENAVIHLKDSNVQLEEALRDSVPDEEYQTALSENKIVITGLEQKIKQLEEDIKAAEALVNETRGDDTAMTDDQNDPSAGAWL